MALSLKAARIDARLKLTEAAKALEISRNTLGNYEKYKTIPDIEMAYKMAALYHRSVDELKFF